LIIDRKFKPKDLKTPRNQVYVRDLGQVFKIFQKWGYDIIWVENGVDAMRALREYPDEISCVVVEAYIPGGGFTISRLIRFKPDCRHIPVFIMSSQLTEKDLEEGKRIGIHDCLPRPFNDVDFLESKLQDGADKTGGEGAKEKVDPKTHITRELDKITGLPAMPTVYNEIEKLSRDPKSTTEQYSTVIELDPGITTQMLKLCNSSAFSFSRRISTINDAVNLLGLQTVIDFVRTLSVVGAFKGAAPAFDNQEFWRHCIGCGVAAKLLVQQEERMKNLNLGEDDPFMAGMVHDIGKQVLGYFFNEMFTMVADEIRTTGHTMYAVEQDVLGITHADIGSALSEKWQLPDMLSQVIGYHHRPGGGDEIRDMVHLVHLSDQCAKQIGFAFVEKKSDLAIAQTTLDKIGMEPDAIAAVFKEIEGTARSQVTDTFSAIFS
jgi:HD-like signal output (HDOD) protein